MYDNLLHQAAAARLAADIKNAALPGALLFSGAECSGKLTGALETARILSCTAAPQGGWNCVCPSCTQHKSLVNANLLLAGPRACTTEIEAASALFLKAAESNAPFLTAARYLYLRAARKLTLRFSGVLWDGDDKFSKIAAAIAEIDELMEPLDFPHTLPELKTVRKTAEKLSAHFQKLEGTFLYDSIPVSQMRNASAWARIKSFDGKKTIIIENADRMLESVRNALLKILEEPPEDTVFILTTTCRAAVMPTILSRVRTYQFAKRNAEQERNVLDRVFHAETFTGSISDYLLSYLPVPPPVVRAAAQAFFADIAAFRIPDIPATVKECGAFNPRIALKIFLDGITGAQRKLLFSPLGGAASREVLAALEACWNSVTVYNLSPTAALETLVRSLLKTNKQYGGVFECAV